MKFLHFLRRSFTLSPQYGNLRQLYILSTMCLELLWRHILESCLLDNCYVLMRKRLID